MTEDIESEADVAEARAFFAGLDDHDTQDEPLPPVTLDTAREVLSHFLTALGECDDLCEVRSYDWLLKTYGADTSGKMRDEGWQHLTERSGAVRRCEHCASVPKYPWMAAVDPERFRQWWQDRLDSKHPGIDGTGAFCAEDLRVLL
jgi:hypothetical protein